MTRWSPPIAWRYHNRMLNPKNALQDIMNRWIRNQAINLKREFEQQGIQIPGPTEVQEEKLRRITELTIQAQKHGIYINISPNGKIPHVNFQINGDDTSNEEIESYANQVATEIHGMFNDLEQ